MGGIELILLVRTHMQGHWDGVTAPTIELLYTIELRGQKERACVVASEDCLGYHCDYRCVIRTICNAFDTSVYKESLQCL